MTNEIDYREVLMHYSKPIIEGGMEYTDDKKKAEIVAVFVQSWFKKEDESSCEFFDIDQEKDFSIKELGHDRAVEEAKKYASELCSKYKTDWEWY